MKTNQVTQEELNNDTNIVIDLFQTALANVFWILWTATIIGTIGLSFEYVNTFDAEIKPLVLCFVIILLSTMVRELPTLKFIYKQRKE